MSTKITTMSYIYECLEEFKKSILNVDKIHVKIVDSDKQFKLECKKSNLNCLYQFKKISELIINWIKNPHIKINTDEIKTEYINLYVKIVVGINDFTNLELNANNVSLELETEYASLLSVIEFKLNIINSEILKRENKNKKTKKEI